MGFITTEGTLTPKTAESLPTEFRAIASGHALSPRRVDNRTDITGAASLVDRSSLCESLKPKAL